MKTNKEYLQQQLPALLLGLAILIYATGFSYLTVTRYAAFEARALDLGNLHQTVWNTANGHPFHMTNQPGTVNRLSLHVEPILLPIAALYWIHDGPETLLVLQSVVVALGAWPLYMLARQRLRERLVHAKVPSSHRLADDVTGVAPAWIALLLALVYLLNPTIQAANWLEFHPVTLAPTFLMAAFYFLVSGHNGWGHNGWGHNGWFALFALLAAACKEEIGLLLFMMGGYALVVLRRPRIGLLTMGLTLGWSLFAVLGIQQFFADGNIHWGRYDYLGASPLDKVVALLTQPALVWHQLQQADALGYLWRLLWPVGCMALLAPEVLFLALPSLAVNLLADFPPMHEVYTLIYAAPILPFVMLAMVEGVRRVVGAQWMRVQWVGVQWVAGSRWQVAGLLSLFTLGCAVVAQGQHGYLPGGGNYRLYTVTEHDQRAAAIIAQIPPDAKVSAQDKLDPHVAGRETVYIYPRIEDADTIFVDVTGPAWPQHPSDLYADVQQLLDTEWGVAAGDDGYLLLRKGAPEQTLPDSFYSAFRRPAPISPPQQAVSSFGETLTLLDHQISVDEHGETVVQLWWQPMVHPLSTDYRIYVAFADATGTIVHDTLFYPPVATLWYPTSMWRADETVLVQTLPWQLDLAQFTLLVGVYTGEEGWHNGGRLPLSSTPTPEKIHLEQNTIVRLDSYRWTGEAWQPVLLRKQLESTATTVGVQFNDGKTALNLQQVLIEKEATQAGETLAFALQWEAGPTPIPLDYSLFAHLLNAAGEKVAQLDWQPQDDWGPRPMTTWFPATAMVDRQQFPLPADLPPGDYRLILGVYNWQTGERLVANGNRAETDDVITIAQFSIK